ncbi:hypothetical protein EDM27_15510, partial [Staphylococcus aureus]
MINNRVKEVIAGFDFTYGKFGKGNMSVLNEMDEFSTTIVGKQEMETEKISTTAIRDKLEMIEQHDVDYCIVINFSSRFASVTAEEFVQDYIINNRVKEVIAGFDFTYGKFGKG